MNNDVEEVKSRLNIVDIVGDYVRLERAGAGQWKGLCPFHKEKSPSFTVSEERQLWHCFGCGKGGDLFSFVMEQEGTDFRDTLVMLAERAGVTLSKGRGDGESGVNADKKKTYFDILDLATKFYQKQLTVGIGTRAARPYLVDRGINEISMANFRLGFAPDGWRHITEFLVGRGFALADIAATGLIIQKDGTRGMDAQDYYDRFRNRIMFPITDPMGRVIGFSARILPSEDEGGKKPAKYINTSESPVYHKSSVLYGIAQAKQAMKDVGRVVVVEGNMDVVAAHQAGVTETVAVSGTALTEDHARIMRRYAPEVVLFFDNDVAGQNAAKKSVMICVAAGLTARMVVVDGAAKDAAEIVRENPEELKRLIDHAQSAMQILVAQALATHDVAQPEGRQAILREIVPLVAAHASRVDQEYWLQRLSQDAQIPMDTGMAMVAQMQMQMETHPATEQDVSEQPVARTHTSRSDVLCARILSLAAQSNTAFDALLAQDLSTQFLAQHKALHVLMMAGATGATSYAGAMESVSDRALYGELVQVMGTHTAETTSVLETYTQEQIAKEIASLVKLMSAAWYKEERTRLIAALAQAETAGDRVRQKEILAHIQALM